MICFDFELYQSNKDDNHVYLAGGCINKAGKLRTDNDNEYTMGIS